MTDTTAAAIDQFASLAASYCELIEHHADYSTEDFIGKVRLLLPQLYYHALQLPDVEPVNDDRLPRVAHQEWQQMFANLGAFLGSNDLYWVVFDPLKLEPDSPIAASLADDLTDIWRDLKSGLRHWQASPADVRQEIVWGWRFHFQIHWSYHVVDALRAINAISESYGVREG
jgi:hypothetical protein